MKLFEKTWPRLLKKGVVMEQHKEPALARKIHQFITDGAIQSIEGYQPVGSIDEITPEEIIRVAKQARIIDERDGLPLYKKLRFCIDKKVELLVDAIDDEPYVSSQLGLVLHKRRECVGGIRLALKAIGATDASICIYKELGGVEIRMPSKIDTIPLRRVGGVYPTEIHQIGSYSEEEGKRYLYLGSGTLLHLYRAVYEGRVQTTAFITVSGNCVQEMMNLEVSLDKNVTEVLEHCRLMDEPTRIIVGGSITGASVDDTDRIPIGVMTRAVLAFKEDERDKKYRCIGCGRCIDACPMGLNPLLIYQKARADRLEKIEETDYTYCVQCMTCSYVCPAKIDLAGQIAALKRRKREQQNEGRAASGATYQEHNQQ